LCTCVLWFRFNLQGEIPDVSNGFGSTEFDVESKFVETDMVECFNAGTVHGVSTGAVLGKIRYLTVCIPEAPLD